MQSRFLNRFLVDSLSDRQRYRQYGAHLWRVTDSMHNSMIKTVSTGLLAFRLISTLALFSFPETRLG